jgi:hypothetical protein
MSDTRLYSVIPQGEATPPSDQPPADPGPRRAASKARPRYAVPTDRMRFDVQVKALRVIASASRNGTELVDAAKMGTLMGITAATAVLNNAFFVSVGLIERIGKGDYKPSTATLEFQRKYSFEKDAAAPILMPAFKDTWFMDAVRQKLDINENTTRDEMIMVLAGEAETDDSYATQYGFLLDWLNYVGLITMSDGLVQLTSTAAGSEVVVVTETETESIVDVGSVVDVPSRATATATPAASAPGTAPAVVSLSFDVAVTAEDLAKLTSEQIASLFEGLGRLATIKAVLGKN